MANALVNPGFEGSELPWTFADGSWATGVGVTGAGIILTCTGGVLGAPPIEGTLTQTSIVTIPGRVCRIGVWAYCKAQPLPYVYLEAGILDGITPVYLGTRLVARNSYEWLDFGSYTPVSTSATLTFTATLATPERISHVYLDDALLDVPIPVATISQYYPPDTGPTPSHFRLWAIDDILGVMAPERTMGRDRNGNLRIAEDLGAIDRDDVVAMFTPRSERALEEL